MAGVSSDVKGYNLYAYCFNNPVNMTDASGNWPQWLDNLTEKWKEKSFVHNVISKNIQADSGVGIGVGGAISIAAIEVAAISRVDVIGVEVSGKRKNGDIGDET